MKKIILTSLVFFALLMSFTSCYRVSPNGDQESVLIYKPFFFGHGGVDTTAIPSGTTWCWPTTDHMEFTITPITYTEEFVNLIPSDNTPVSFAVYLKLQIRKGMSPLLFKNFGEKWYENSLKPTFRTMVRDKACPYKMFDLASKREISSAVEVQLDSAISDYVNKIGLPVNVLKVSVGAITPPDQVLTETKNTAAQNQSILTQDARAKAETSRKQAEINKAIADRAYKETMNMTVEQYLSLRHLEIEKEKVELIKDNKNISIIFGNANPVFPVK